MDNFTLMICTFAMLGVALALGHHILEVRSYCKKHNSKRK